MNKESLLKAREFLLGLTTLDIPIEDKIELYNNLYLLLDPDNYNEHIISLGKEFNFDLKWKTKGK